MNLAPAQKASEYAHMVVNCLSEAPKPCTSARLRPAASGPTSESAKILRTDPWKKKRETTHDQWQPLGGMLNERKCKTARAGRPGG